MRRRRAGRRRPLRAARRRCAPAAGAGELGEAFAARVTDHGRQVHRRWVTETFGPASADRRALRDGGCVDLLVVATDVYTWKLLRRDRAPVGGQDPGAHGGARARGPRGARPRRPSLSHASHGSVRSPTPPLKEAAMAEIVVVTWDGGGNVPPALAIARELGGARARRPGARATASQREAVEAAGVHGRRRRARRGSSPPAAAHSDRELIATFGDRGTGRDLAAELARHRPTSCSSTRSPFGALEAARAGECRYAVLEHFFDAYYQSLLRGPLGLVLRARGLRPGRSLRDGGGARRDVAARARHGAPRAAHGAPGRPGRGVETRASQREPTVLVEPEHLRLRRDARSASSTVARRVRRPARTGRRDDRPARRPGGAAGAGRGRGAPVRAARRR